VTNFQLTITLTVYMLIILGQLLEMFFTNYIFGKTALFSLALSY